MKTGCGHGPNECDPRNPDCLSDIIASQNREINRLREELAKKLVDVLREEIIRPYIERTANPKPVRCPHTWVYASWNSPPGLVCALCGLRDGGVLPSP